MYKRALKLLQHLEARLLLLLGSGAAAAWAFLAIGSEMREGETLALDRHILLAFRSPTDPSRPLGSQSFQEAMRDITALGGFTVLTLVTLVAAVALHCMASSAMPWCSSPPSCSRKWAASG